VPRLRHSYLALREMFSVDVQEKRRKEPFLTLEKTPDLDRNRRASTTKRGRGAVPFAALGKKRGKALTEEMAASLRSTK